MRKESARFRVDILFLNMGGIPLSRIEVPKSPTFQPVGNQSVIPKNDLTADKFPALCAQRAASHRGVMRPYPQYIAIKSDEYPKGVANTLVLTEYLFSAPY